MLNLTLLVIFCPTVSCLLFLFTIFVVGSLKNLLLSYERHCYHHLLPRSGLPLLRLVAGRHSHLHCLWSSRMYCLVEVYRWRWPWGTSVLVVGRCLIYFSLQPAPGPCLFYALLLTHCPFRTRHLIALNEIVSQNFPFSTNIFTFAMQQAFKYIMTTENNDIQSLPHSNDSQ